MSHTISTLHVLSNLSMSQLHLASYHNLVMYINNSHLFCFWILDLACTLWGGFISASPHVSSTELWKICFQDGALTCWEVRAGQGWGQEPRAASLGASVWPGHPQSSWQGFKVNNSKTESSGNCYILWCTSSHIVSFPPFSIKKS